MDEIEFVDLADALPCFDRAPPSLNARQRVKQWLPYFFDAYWYADE